MSRQRKNDPAAEDRIEAQPSEAARRGTDSVGQAAGFTGPAEDFAGGCFFSTSARRVHWLLLALLPVAVWPKIQALMSPYILVKMAVLGYVGGIALALAGGALLFERDSARRAARWAASPAGWGFLGTGAALGLAAAFSRQPGYSWNQLWFLLAPLALGAACAWTFPGTSHTRTGAWIMIAGGIAVAAIGLADASGTVPLFQWLYGKTPEQLLQERGTALLRSMQGGLERGRMISTLGNPAYTGGFLIIPILLLFGWLTSGWDGRRPKGLRAALGAAGLGIMGFALVLTSTREAWLGIAAGILIWTLLGLPLLRRRIEPKSTNPSAVPEAQSPPPHARLRSPWMLGGAAIGGLMLILVIFSTSNPLNVRGWNVAGRFRELANPRSDSVRERVLFYSLAARMFLERPLVGWGPGMFGVRFYPALEQHLESGPAGPWSKIIEDLQGRVAEQAHNEIFQIAAECGVLGLAPFLWLLSCLLYSIGKNLLSPLSMQSDGAFLRVLGVAWLGAFPALLTSFPLHTPSRSLYFWTLTGWLAMRLARGAGGEDAESPANSGKNTDG